MAISFLSPGRDKCSKSDKKKLSGRGFECLLTARHVAVPAKGNNKTSKTNEAAGTYFSIQEPPRNANLLRKLK